MKKATLKGGMFFTESYPTGDMLRYVENGWIMAFDYSPEHTAWERLWIITKEGAWAIRPEDADLIYERLIKPPLLFCLALVAPVSDSEVKRNSEYLHLHPRQALAVKDHLHLELLVCNQHTEVKGDTQLKYTINDRAYEFTTYELQHALTNGANGVAGGIRVLIETLGQPAREKSDLLDLPREYEEVKPPVPTRGKKKPSADDSRRSTRRGV